MIWPSMGSGMGWVRCSTSPNAVSLLRISRRGAISEHEGQLFIFESAAVVRYLPLPVSFDLTQMLNLMQNKFNIWITGIRADLNTKVLAIIRSCVCHEDSCVNFLYLHHPRPCLNDNQFYRTILEYRSKLRVFRHC